MSLLGSCRRRRKEQVTSGSSLASNSVHLLFLTKLCDAVRQGDEKTSETSSSEPRQLESVEEEDNSGDSTALSSIIDANEKAEDVSEEIITSEATVEPTIGEVEMENELM